MKRLSILFAAALLALIPTACENDGGGNGEATGFEGEWIAIKDDYHPLTITFEGKTYVWEVKGIAPRRDKGTFTYEGGYLTLNATENYEPDDETGKMKKVGNGGKAYHKYQILLLEGNVCVAKSVVNDFFAEGWKMYWTRGTDKQDIKESSLKGTWVSEDENGSKYIFTFDGKNYVYYCMSQYNVRVGEEWVLKTGCIKETGSWEHKSGILKLTPNHLYYSYENLKEGTVYYEVNEETGEAETWVEAPASHLYPGEYELHLSGNSVYVGMDMTALVFTKKD